jgi:hypothetical protein
MANVSPSSRFRAWSRPGPRDELDRERLGVALFLAAAAASFVLSVSLWFAGDRLYGVFVGLWVPSILAAGGFWMIAQMRQT